MAVFAKATALQPELYPMLIGSFSPTGERKILLVSSVAVFIFFPATAWAGVVSTNLDAYLNRFPVGLLCWCTCLKVVRS